MADNGINSNFNFFRPSATPTRGNPFSSPDIKERYGNNENRSFSFLQNDSVTLSSHGDSDFNQVRDQSFALRNFQKNSLTNTNFTNEQPTSNTESGGTDRKVTVQRDDSLSKILVRVGYPREKAYDAKVQDEIASKNKLANKNLIRPGETLMIPEYKKPEKSQSDTSNAEKSTETTSNTQPQQKAPTTSNAQTVSQTRTKKPSTPTAQSKKPANKPQPTKTAKTEQSKMEERYSNSKFAVRKVTDHLVSKGFAAEHIWVYDAGQAGDGTMRINAKIKNPGDPRDGKEWRFEVVNGKIKKEYAI